MNSLLLLGQEYCRGKPADIGVDEANINSESEEDGSNAFDEFDESKRGIL